MKYTAVIPVYNNAATLEDIIVRTLAVTRDVLVVDDGSTDCDVPALCSKHSVGCLRHGVNLGKGAAIRTALAHLAGKRVDYMVTLDADGQHYPEDISAFVPLMEKNRYSIFVGCRDFSSPDVPDSSRFGRDFANFWMYLETGVRVGDCQSGFRAYPVKYIKHLRFISNKYNFEAEILVRAAWGNLEIHDVPVRTYYPPAGVKRVSHFRPFLDNFRFSLIHFHLVGLRFLPFPKRKLRRAKHTRYSIFNPKKLFMELLRENASPEGLAASAAAGSFIAVLPIFGFHIVAIIYVTERLHLNKLLALAVQNLFAPPLSPFLCIELGYFMMHGEFLTELTFTTLVAQMHIRLWEWFAGSLALAPFWACVAGVCTYYTAKSYIRLKNKLAEKKKNAVQ